MIPLGSQPDRTVRVRHVPLGRPIVGAVSYPESLRDPIPQNEAYPISRTALDSALSDAGVATLSMIYCLRAGVCEFRDSDVGDVMEISFKAATADRPERTEIRIHAVPAVSKQVIGVALASLLDEVAAWVRRSERSEKLWRSTDTMVWCSAGTATTFGSMNDDRPCSARSASVSHLPSNGRPSYYWSCRPPRCPRSTGTSSPGRK